MEQLNKLETHALVDLLSEYTTTYTKLLARKEYNAEYHFTKEAIRFIQNIIESRKNDDANLSMGR